MLDMEQDWQPKEQEVELLATSEMAMQEPEDKTQPIGQLVQIEALVVLQVEQLLEQTMHMPFIKAIFE